MGSAPFSKIGESQSLFFLGFGVPDQYYFGSRYSASTFTRCQKSYTPPAPVGKFPNLILHQYNIYGEVGLHFTVL